MDIVVGKGILIKDYPPNFFIPFAKEFSLANPKYEEARKRRKPTWGMDKKIVLYARDSEGLHIGRGLLNKLGQFLDEYKHKFNFIDDRVKGKSIRFGDIRCAESRDYQDKAVAAMIVHSTGILQAPAGSGKTIMGLRIISAKSVPTLWLVHTKELLKQAETRASKHFCDVGTIGLIYGDEKRIGDGKLIIATVNTLVNNPSLVESLSRYIGCVILDEAHHAPANTFLEVMTQFKSQCIFGLTATPYRADGLEPIMHAALGPIRCAVEREELYESGALIKPVIRPIYTKFKYSQAAIKSETGAVDAGGDNFDYHALLNAIYEDEDRLKLIAINIVENYSSTNYQLVLVDNKSYMKKIKFYTDKFLELSKLDVATYILTSDLTKKHRSLLMQQFYDKQIHIIFATQLAREGLDIPHLNIVHLTTPRKGDALVRGGAKGNVLEQEIGRIMRPDPDNPSKIGTIYDYVDYDTSILLTQYRTRCKVYKRLLLNVPRKPKTTEEQEVDNYFNKLGNIGK